MVDKELLKSSINSFCGAFDFSYFKPFRPTNRFIDKLVNHYDCLQFSEVMFENKPYGLSLNDDYLHQNYVLHLSSPQFRIIDLDLLAKCSEAYSRVEKMYKDFESERVRYDSNVYSEYWDDEGLDYMNPIISFIKDCRKKIGTGYKDRFWMTPLEYGGISTVIYLYARDIPWMKSDYIWVIKRQGTW